MSLSTVRPARCSWVSAATNHASFVPVPVTAPLFLFKARYSIQTTSTASEAELASARTWLSKFLPNTLPRDVGQVTYSRSSGPGGQNVNKVNSKAQLRVPVDQLLPRIPTLLHSAVLSSRFYAEKSRSIVVQADDSRSQSANKDICYSKLHELLVRLAKEKIPGETSQAQREKVKILQRSDNEARIRNKKWLSSKKVSRSKSGSD